MKRVILLAIVLAVASPPLSAEVDDKASNVPALMALFRNIKTTLPKMAVLASPGEKEGILFVPTDSSIQIKVIGCGGDLTCKGAGPYMKLEAPAKPGNYRFKVRIMANRSGRADKVGLFGLSGKKSDDGFTTFDVPMAVMVSFPHDMVEDGKLNGFELGEYPDLDKIINKELYKPPEQFWYLEKDLMGYHVSEHLELGDLGYDVRAAIPQYFTLDYELVIKLEAILYELKIRGLPARYQFIGGGFISPKSNERRTRRNRAAADLSRHMWGEAIDFIIDEDPRDQVMDDMNMDGVIDVRDAFVVRDIVLELEEEGRVKPGGIGVYSPPKNSMIQLHVDVRGFQVQWGVKEYDPEIFAGQPAKRSLRPGG